MRRLLLLRGAPGAGKTTFVNETGLGPYSISLDAVRALLAGPVLDRGGKLSVSQENPEATFSLFNRMVEERMGRGELLVIDSTAQTNGDIDPWLAVARHHRYRVAVLDFSTMPIEQVKAQNAARPALTQVGEVIIERAYQRFAQNRPLAKSVEIIPWDEGGHYKELVTGFLDVPTRDLSAFERIVYVGDIQGCFTPLAGPGGLLEQGLRDDTFYVFVGDLVDRGPENGKVVRWFLEHIVGKPNAVVLWGNHEDHLHRFARGLPAVSAEFGERTAPQLAQAGIAPADAERICAMLVEVFPHTWRGQRILATHAGLPTVPERLATISAYQYSHGTGQWSDPIDQQFERYAPKGWTQVHGHRNHGWQPIVSSCSINLEDQVESGGYLRAAVLSETGWEGIAVPNLKGALAWRERRQHERDWQDAPAWMRRPADTRLSDDVLTAMRAHPGVKEKTSASTPHIASLNFTKQVFFDQSWDDVVVKARGLFFDTNTGEIAARAYEKFFNVGEREETSIAALAGTLAWPVTAYIKENGFLGLIGIDPATNQLFLSSKSTPDSDFAGWFREIFEATTTAGQREAIRRKLVDHELSLAVEVIDPVRDPHMIDYPASKLVVLDAFHRATQTERLPYENLVALCERLELTPKERGMAFKNANAFAGWYNAVHRDLTYRHRGTDIEGYVLEDLNGQQVKVKLPHYAFWKRMRSGKDRLARLMTKEAEARERAGVRPGKEAKNAELAAAERERTVARDPHPLARAFLSWANRQPVERLKTSSILALRSAFVQDANPDPNWLNEPWVAFEPPEEKGSVSVNRVPKP